MTPQDFPDNASYQRYICQCEASMEWEDWESKYNFAAVTEIVTEFGGHWETCENREDPSCWCRGDEDGFIYTYARGMILAQHTTHPMFEVKNDLGPHNYVDGNGTPGCSWCHPEAYYWGSNGAKIDRETAERMWWADHLYGWEGAYVDFFDEANLPRPAYEPHKNGPHP